MTSPDVAKQLARLSRIRAGSNRIVSCYLKLEPRDRSRGKYLIKLKNRIRIVGEAVDSLDIPRVTREQVRHDLGRIEEFLRQPGNLPSTQALAIFASKPLGLFESIPLPWVHRSRLVVDRTPLVRELASIEDEFGRIITVVYDRTSARLFEVTAFQCSELSGVPAVYTRGKRYHGEKQGMFGPSEHDYHTRIREEKHRHFAQIAQQLFNLHQKQPYLGLVLGSPGPEKRTIESFLHPYLAGRVMGAVRLNPKDASVAAVRAATLTVRQDYEREEERTLMNDLVEKLGTGWAVSGMAPTLRALSRGQVRILLVGADSAVAGFRCKDSGRLTLGESECRDEGGAVPVLDVVDDAIEEALRQQVSVNVVYDEAATEKIEGLAGLLRFR